MSKREIAAAAAKKYILSTTNTTASAPTDRHHSVITLITLASLCSLARGTHASAESRNQHEWLKTALRNTLHAVGQTPALRTLCHALAL